MTDDVNHTASAASRSATNRRSRRTVTPSDPATSVSAPSVVPSRIPTSDGGLINSPSRAITTVERGPSRTSPSADV